MIETEKAVEINKIVITGTDVKALKHVCQLIDEKAQVIMDNSRSQVNLYIQESVEFSRRFLREYK